MTKLRTYCIVCLFSAAAVIASPAQNVFFTSLASFDGTNGAGPGYYMSLAQGSNGGIYGTAAYGGGYFDTCQYPPGCGTVFTVTLAGALTTLHTFDLSDGAHPQAGLLQGTDGNFYGTTSGGGGYGWGTVFKITLSGTLTTLYSFCAQPRCADGVWPYAGLVQGSDGNFYGTTRDSGANGNGGTVFRITPNGTLTTLYSFCSQRNCPDGMYPGALVQANDGNFYGTTIEGGSNNSGTIFRITLSGELLTLHSFDGSDGVIPYAGLVQANDGSLYGITRDGGDYGWGTVFKITTSGVLTTLHSFDGSDGGEAYATLVQANDGDLYGTAFYGGTSGNCTYGCGTVFKITLAGAITVLHSFDYTDGASPYGGLLQGRDGSFYGTTSQGGAYGNGTVFRLLGPRTPCATCRP